MKRWANGWKCWRSVSFCSLILCLILGAAGCRSTPKECRVALLVKSTETEYWKQVYKGAYAFANKQGITLDFCGPKEESHADEQVDIFEDCIRSGYDAIVLAAADYNLLENPVREANIPVILVDCAVNGEVGDSFVGTDNYAAGASLAEKFLEDNGKTGKLAMISFVKNTGPAIDREKGFRDVMENNSEIEILDTEYCQSSVEISRKITQRILEEHPDVDMIVGMNAQSLMGAAEALKNWENTGEKIYLGGIDCLAEEAVYIEEGIIDVCILQNPYMMGYYGVENAWNVLQGAQVPEKEWVDTYVIDRETLFEKRSQELIFPFES